eukprot:524245-Amorphochlora_amoeboformis.AAC.2
MGRRCGLSVAQETICDRCAVWILDYIGRADTVNIDGGLVEGDGEHVLCRVACQFGVSSSRSGGYIGFGYILMTSVSG